MVDENKLQRDLRIGNLNAKIFGPANLSALETTILSIRPLGPRLTPLDVPDYLIVVAQPKDNKGMVLVNAVVFSSEDANTLAYAYPGTGQKPLEESLPGKPVRAYYMGNNLTGLEPLHD